MKKKTVWILLLLITIGVVIFFLARKPKEEPVEEQEDIIEEMEEVSEEEEEVDEEEKVVEEQSTGSTDFSKFSSEKQVLGKESESEFTIGEIADQSMKTYHLFTFTLTTEDEQEPFVSGTYLPNIGAVRLDFQGIKADKSGLGYQQEKVIGEQGVLKIYHNVSAQNDQELYDIGVSKSTIFYLSSEELEKGKWRVKLEVKYPGVADIDVDLGSKEFSKEDQSIVGVTAKEKATISAYTYGRSSGLLKLVWSVSSSSENPLPSVNASYNGDGDLVVTFESLSMDRIANSSDTLSLPSGITADVKREGESSVYTFTGMDEVREYKLNGSLSPNQIVLEIK
jgi:hypothetical protein